MASAELVKIGENVQLKDEGGLLVLVIDPRRDLGPTKTGKSTAVAKTEMFAPVPGHPALRLNLMLIRK